MIRRVSVLTVVGAFALGGCASGRSAMPELTPLADPVAAEPLPGIKESINGPLPPRTEARPAASPAPEPVTPPPGPVAPAEDGIRGQNPDPAQERRAAPAKPAGPTTAMTAPASVTAAETAVRSTISPGKLVGLTVATVGGEAITGREVEMRFAEFVRENGNGEPIPLESQSMIMNQMRRQLIDRALIVQEAKRVMLKSDNQKKGFNEFADRIWKEKEIPRLLQKHKATSEADLQMKMDKMGRSLAEMRESWHKEFLSHEYMMEKIRSRIRPSYPEMKAYYEEHIMDFDSPAKVTWREIVVKVKDESDRTDARRRADALLDELRHGADFGKLAVAKSDGPTARKGGSWGETGLDVSPVPAVNAALEQLVVNQPSAVLEGPDSFHIIRVEDRRAAGPLPFSKAQTQIFKTLFDKNLEREQDNFLNKLRSKTIVRIWEPGKGLIPIDYHAVRVGGGQVANP